MDSNLDSKQSLTTVLDYNSLEELLSRCKINDLLNLSLTSTLNRDLVRKSQLIWARRLYIDYGIKLGLLPEAQPGALYDFAKQVYTAQPPQVVRFQGVLTTGGVDANNLWYWVDNLFNPNNSYYCSDASANVDCLGLLVDGNVQRELEYDNFRSYMRRRVRYAAALFSQLHNPFPGGVDSLMNIVDSWSDQRLEQFFLTLAQQLADNHPVGRLLLYDVPFDRRVEVEQQIQQICRALDRRLDAMSKKIKKMPGEHSESVFDHSLLSTLKTGEPRMVGIINSLHLSRAGSLTCPVAAGVVFVGTIDYSKLDAIAKEWKEEKAEKEVEMGVLLKSLAQDPVCTNFNDLSSIERLTNQARRGKLPRTVREDIERAGIYCVFDVDANDEHYDPSSLSRRPGGGGSSRGRSGIKWQPLVWFRFHSREDAEMYDLAHGGGGDNVAEQGGGEEAQPAENAEIVANQEHQQQRQEEDIGLEDIGLQRGDEDGEPLNLGLLVDQYDDNDDNEEEGEEEELGSDEEEELNSSDEEEEQEQPVEGGLINDDDENGEHTLGRNQLFVQLPKPVTANIVLVKLISQENLMEELMDEHSYPNIDMTHVKLLGKAVSLPKGVVLRP